MINSMDSSDSSQNSPTDVTAPQPKDLKDKKTAPVTKKTVKKNTAPSKKEQVAGTTPETLEPSKKTTASKTPKSQKPKAASAESAPENAVETAKKVPTAKPMRKGATAKKQVEASSAPSLNAEDVAGDVERKKQQKTTGREQGKTASRPSGRKSFEKSTDKIVQTVETLSIAVEELVNFADNSSQHNEMLEANEQPSALANANNSEKAEKAGEKSRRSASRGRRKTNSGKIANEQPLVSPQEKPKDTLLEGEVLEPFAPLALDGEEAVIGNERSESDNIEANAENKLGTTEKKKRSRSRGGRGRKKNNKTNETLGAVSESSELIESTLPDTEEQDAKNQNKKKKSLPKQEEAKAQAKATRRKMFVSVVPEEQVEVVLTEEGQVQEYYVEMMHQLKTKGNIYKGIVHNVDPNLQAAFVSYGAVKNGFLQIDEVHPEYYAVPHENLKGKKYPPLQKVLKPGQEVLVQVVKEPAGTKGAFLTTYLSLPGRYLVLTPGREQIGVSRKVDNEAERARLREMLEGLEPGAGLGVIVRTVSMGTSKDNLQADLQYLKKNWMEVRTKGTTLEAPCLIYQELDLATRAVRDYLNDSVAEVWIDDSTAADSISEMAAGLFPQKSNLVRLYSDGQPLFERYNIQRQIDQIHSREVSLPSGGRLVIDPTEALTAIDINSGRSGGKNNFEDMAYRTNMEAAKMIPLQLRLRDIGGQVVIDFIEMRDKNHWREVEKTLRDSMKIDRARHDIGKISSFGLLEIVRQRLGSSAISISTEPCPHCKGTGIRRNMEWQAQKALRDIAKAMRLAKEQEQHNAVYEAEPNLAWSLLNSKRQRLFEMEQNYGVSLEIRPKSEQF